MIKILLYKDLKKLNQTERIKKIMKKKSKRKWGKRSSYERRSYFMKKRKRLLTRLENEKVMKENIINKLIDF